LEREKDRKREPRRGIRKREFWKGIKRGRGDLGERGIGHWEKKREKD
jgi:hypothetical protein